MPLLRRNSQTVISPDLQGLENPMSGMSRHGTQGRNARSGNEIVACEKSIGVRKSRTMKKFVLILTVPLTLGILTGCKHVLEAVPEKREIVTEEQVVETSPDGSTITNSVFRTNSITFTNYYVRDDVEGWIQAAGEVNQLANPTPSAPLVNGGLAGLSSILVLLAGIQTWRRNRSQRVALAMAQGVEKTDDGVVKRSIKHQSEVMGVANDVFKIVKKIGG